MRVLVLTSSLVPCNGYGVLSMYTCNNIQKLDGKIILDVFTAEAGNSLRIGRRNLQSERVLRSRLLLPLVLAWDLLCVLSGIRGKVDLIHVMVEHYSLVGMFLSRILRAPYIVTVCGTYAVRLPVFSKAFRYAYEKAHSLVAISNYTRERMIEIGIKRKIEVITLGVDKSVFQPPSQNARSDEVLFVGNLKARKGFDMVLKAMETVNARRKDIGLVVAGKVNLDSMEAKRVLGIIESKRLNVKFTGFVTEKELIRLYQTAKLNVLPSKSEPFFFEGFGLVHLEANACGALSVGTLNSGNEDAIQKGYGFLIEYGNDIKLADIILEVCGLAPYPILDTERLPGWDAPARRYLSIYKTLLEGENCER